MSEKMWFIYIIEVYSGHKKQFHRNVYEKETVIPNNLRNLCSDTSLALFS